LLNSWGISAVIALNDKNNNRGNFKFKQNFLINRDGTPVCPAGRNMVLWGFCKGRSRHKWRCPRVVNNLESCAACGSCSSSPYGRVFYTKPDWDVRLFTKIPRGSDEWKDKMKQRTAAERVNDRILNDYGIEHANTRGKKRIAFFTTVAAINIHLDAQLKFMSENGLFDFYGLVFMREAA
jgi:hypothetical protein